VAADFSWPWTSAGQILKQVLTNTQELLSKVDVMAAGLTNLQAADTALQAEVIEILTDIQTALATDDPDAAVQAASDIVNKAVTDLKAGDPNPPVTPPAS
jgi:hypothetical protein